MKRSIDSLGLISVSSINTLLRCWNLEITSTYLGFSQQSYHVDFPQGVGQAEKSFDVRDLDLVHHLTCENHHHLDSLILLIIWLSLQLSSEGSDARTLLTPMSTDTPRLIPSTANTTSGYTTRPPPVARISLF